MKSKIWKASVISLATLSVLGAFAACGKKNKTTPTTKVSLNAVAVGTTSFVGRSEKLLTSVGGLNALKYMISAISICEGVEINGTGFNNTSICSAIYSASIPAGLSDSTQEVRMSVVTDMQSGTYDDYQIDLMDATSRAKLNAAASVAAGTYNYAIITWAAPIQFNVALDVGSGVTIYSKAITSVGTGATHSQSTTTGDVRVAPAQDAVVISPNGGTFFKFSEPFVISADDVAAGTAYVIDLVFNPEDVIRGSADPNALSMSSWFKGSSGGLYVPMLSLSPVPRKASDTNTKEIYTITDTGGTIYRLELYYNTSDTDKNILGASLVATSGLTSDDAKIQSIETVTDKLDFTSTATAGPGSGDGNLINQFVRGSSCAADAVNEVAVATCVLSNTVVIE